MKYHILTFDSTHHVLKAEKLLKGSGIIHEIIPTPKDISSDCGMSIRIEAAVIDIVVVSKLLSSNSISFMVSGRRAK